MVATLDSGGPAVVVGDRTGYLYAYHLSNGSAVPGWPVSPGQPIDSTPSVAPLGGSGLDDVFVGTGDAKYPHPGGYRAYGPTGSLLWSVQAPNPVSDPNPFSGAQASLTVASLQGTTGVFAGSLGQEAYALKASSGSTLTGWPFFTADSDYSTAAAANLYGNGQEELVVGGSSHAGVAMGQDYSNGGHLRVLNAQGGLIYDYDTNQEVVSSPAVGNFLANGATGIAVGTGTYYPGTADTDTVKAFTTRLGLVWSETLDGPTSSSPALANVQGPGQLDVVEGTETGRLSGSVWALDGANGSTVWKVPAVSRIIGSVVTADLTGGNYQDVLVPTVHGVEVLNGTNGTEITVLGPRLGFQNSPLVTDDPNGTIGITIAGYNGDNVGTVQHYEIPGSDGALAVGTGSWPMFHHDPSLSGVSSPLPGTGTGTPSALTAVAGNGQVSLSWAAPTGGGAPATGYNVYEAAAPGHESGAPLNGATPVPSPTYSVSGLSNGQSYYFEVTAINSAGEGVPSNEASATPSAGPGSPPPPPPPTTTLPTTTTTTAPATTTTTALTTTTTTPPVTTTTAPSTAAKSHTGKPIVTELTNNAVVRGAKVGLALSCRGATCHGSIKLWYDHVLSCEAAYKLGVGAKSVVGVGLKPSLVKRLGTAKGHELVVDQTVTVKGGSTVRHTLRLSS
jgi:hypothetical protein